MEAANAKLASKVDEIDRKNHDLSKTNEHLSKENQDLSRQFSELSEKLKKLESDGSKESGGANTSEEPPYEAAGPRTGDAESGGGQTRGGGGLDPQQEAQLVGNRRLGKIKLNARYNYDREGIQLSTDDGEFDMKFRTMVQADARLYTQANQDPVSSGFYIPRARLYFTGHVTRPIQYNFSVQRAYDAYNILNAYINFHYDDRIMFRFGRFKTPFTYEFYKLHVWQLMAPERSLFANNFKGGRQVGAMAWGDLFESRLEYGVGIFDGPRRSFTDYNSAKDIMAMVNFTPFENRRESILRNFNVGGSFDFGDENNPVTPAVLRTSSNASSVTDDLNQPVNNAVVPFLAFNKNVKERGFRSLWELHMAYYHKGLSLIGAWDGGFADYAVSGASNKSVHLPIGGYFVQAGYILTGETLRGRVLIDPLRPFDLRPGKFGTGAWEVTARYSALTLGNQVFTGGLADPNLWTNRADMVDMGVNWYLNKWVKVYFDWEHAMFAQPVYYRPGGLQRTSDLFWLRMQLYF